MLVIHHNSTGWIETILLLLMLAVLTREAGTICGVTGEQGSDQTGVVKCINK